MRDKFKGGDSMKKINKLFSILTALVITSMLFVSNICVSAFNFPDFTGDENLDIKIYSQGNFRYYIDSESLTPVIIDIEKGTKVFNIPETVVCNGVTYPVKDLVIDGSESRFEFSLETINVSKNIEQIHLSDISVDMNSHLYALKTINVPKGAKLKKIFLPHSPKLKKINLSSNSILEDIYIRSCPKLKKLSLPKTLKSCKIGKNAPKLKVKIAKGNKYLKVKGNQILSKDGKTLYDILGKNSKVTVYKTVKVIGDDALENKYLKTLTIGKNVNKFARESLNVSKKLKIILKNKNKAPKIKKYSIWAYDIKGINFYVQNKKVAKDLKKKLKVSGIETAKILIGKKVVYKIDKLIA